MSRRAECVTPLQRSFREMNGADIVRGPRAARLTDFITVNGTCFHNLWSFPSAFRTQKTHSHAGVISMQRMSVECCSLFTASHCSRGELSGQMLLIFGVSHLFESDKGRIHVSFKLEVSYSLAYVEM